MRLTELHAVTPQGDLVVGSNITARKRLSRY
jgi:hypothetical protein